MGWLKFEKLTRIGLGCRTTDPYRPEWWWILYIYFSWGFANGNWCHLPLSESEILLASPCCIPSLYLPHGSPYLLPFVENLLAWSKPCRCTSVAETLVATSVSLPLPLAPPFLPCSLCLSETYASSPLCLRPLSIGMLIVMVSASCLALYHTHKCQMAMMTALTTYDTLENLGFFWFWVINIFAQLCCFIFLCLSFLGNMLFKFQNISF